MVSICDSWQTKAEKAAQRRNASKHKKRQRVLSRHQKAMAQQLLAFLQEHNQSILLAASRGEDMDIHLWTDMIPVNEDDVDVRKGKPRANSLNERPESPSKNKRRNRSNSDVGGGESGVGLKSPRSKKGRPRSGSNASETMDCADDDCDVASRLCGNHFFGVCHSPFISSATSTGAQQPRSSKSCEFGCFIPACTTGLHPSSKQGNPSLASILLPKSIKNTSRLDSNQEALLAASEAAKASDPSGDPTKFGMDMRYHLHAKVPTSQLQYDPHVHSSLLVQTISNDILAKYECSVANIVYLVINDMLVFDRYRGGIAMADVDRELLLFGGSKRRSVSVGEYRECQLESMQHLPGNVLEYILTFLPESATAAFPQVCKAWCNEMANASQGLWAHLMDRRQWPYDFIEVNDDAPNNRAQAYRSVFVSHYKATRDANAIIQGLEQLVIGNDSDNKSKDVAAYEFREANGRPIAGETFVKSWSPSRVLVGSGDCTLHLYDIVNMSSGNRKRCKQSVRVAVAPFTNSKKRLCTLTGMDLDDQVIGCLYNVGTAYEPEVWFSVISREAVLCAGKGGSNISELQGETVTSYDIKAMIFDWSMSNGDDAVMGWLHNYYVIPSEGDDTVKVNLRISKEFVACGNGDFLFQAFFTATPRDEEFLNGVFGLSKIYLFSSSLGAVTWVSPCNADAFAPSLCKLTPSESPRQLYHEGEPHGVFMSQANAAIKMESGKAVGLVVDGPGRVRLTQSCSTPQPRYSTKIVGRSLNDVVLARLPGFEPVDEETGDSLGRYIPAHNDFFPMVPFHADYLLSFGCLSAFPCLFLRLHHVPSKCVIYQTSMTYYDHVQVPRFSCCADGLNGTVAISVDDIGLLVAGHGISTIHNESWEQKTKRTKGSRNKCKKDYFARGMRRNMV